MGYDMHMSIDKPSSEHASQSACMHHVCSPIVWPTFDTSHDTRYDAKPYNIPHITSQDVNTSSVSLPELGAATAADVNDDVDVMGAGDVHMAVAVAVDGVVAAAEVAAARIEARAADITRLRGRQLNKQHTTILCIR